MAEAGFLIGVEKNPDMIRRLAYAPVLGNAGFENPRCPLISFNTHQVVASPSYHLLRMFSRHRGDELLKTVVDTYEKPQVRTGRLGIEMFDNSYEIKDVRIDGVPVSDISVLSGGWRIPESGTLLPEANRWNRVLLGDSTSYNYEYTATIRRTKGSGQLQFHLRDNGDTGEQADYISLTIGSGMSELYHQVGGVKDSLVSPVRFPFESNRWYTVRMTCENECIRCYVDGMLLHEMYMLPIPSLVSGATLDKENQVIYLKTVNTTSHEEKTSLRIEGVNIRDEAELIQLRGDAKARNTFENPEAVIPVSEPIVFSMTGTPVYNFPPNSVTILKLHIE